ncbi:ABC transporter ATP-binding protein [Microvirga tunisiensis]|jgi:osmoprotectant transport system ATP-binding protein|uniref:ABC transporter ATP-binding protein n=1 Tax=Microvirga tunisiensis TaxID=2108360 RepID=A0A5N7MIC0_9HYPH|nr:ABC transporter ATP-binding protein [Microvirga tunisiensis]MPR08360.1 ABC transporter ATP-binding protein [Microvirga tunisiensis]MPR26568.1 ABC transporter ATP-binding protein [Microvirga tunisiensis]
MISLQDVSKWFPQALSPAVDHLDLHVPAGATCVLLGPSGCGKTTTIRMVNRLIEPSAGRILVEGEDVTRIDPVRLRRRIGYVIQQVGLFPHMTVAENVATVPQLLRWSPVQIQRRVGEMLDLVGLDPGQFMDRYPRQLSGGQRQRVGVARALAADPPVMLMDEPFGSVDPIVRARLQNEFLTILQRLKKTVILVTHDLDEAIHMADLVAVMRDGQLVQFGTPDQLLARPADPFVSDFVGTERALKRLALITAGEVCEAHTGGTLAADMPIIAASASLREGLSLLLMNGSEVVRVVDAEGLEVGVLTLTTIRAHAATIQA